MNRSFAGKERYLVGGAIFIGIIGTIWFGMKYVLALEEQAVVSYKETAQLATEKAELLKVIREQNNTITSYGGKIQNLNTIVEGMEKLVWTDEELLMKYSKVYFLNENYSPPNLVDIDQKYAYNKKNLPEIRGEVWVKLRQLLSRANDDGLNLLVASGYRSFEQQADLKSQYTVTYGSGANQFSADQGYSEHQLGTTVDFTTASLGANFSRFGSSPAYEWLEKNAHRYGFVLSYPPNNSYYKFEPWHWRYVGVELSTRLYNDDGYFYDLDQREIDKYLIKIFD